VSDPQESSLPPTAAAGVETKAAEDIRRLEAIDGELTGMDAALRRLDEGSYGTCEVCGAALSPDAIERDPLAVRCPDHPG
jgi:RNA polymerase-binding transcription factor DksA